MKKIALCRGYARVSYEFKYNVAVYTLGIESIYEYRYTSTLHIDITHTKSNVRGNNST